MWICNCGLKHQVAFVFIFGASLMFSTIPQLFRCSHMDDEYLPQHLYLKDAGGIDKVHRWDQNMKSSVDKSSITVSRTIKGRQLLPRDVNDFPTRNASVVLIVTLSIWPVVKTGGIAAMFTTYAKLWARQHYRVEVLVPKSCNENAANAYWRPIGVSVSCLSFEDSDNHLFGTRHMKTAYHVLLNLKERASRQKIDAIVFHDWQGIAHYTIHAKRSGTFSKNILLIVMCHTSTQEAKKWKGEPVDTQRAVTVSMEDYSRTFADLSIYPSFFFQSLMHNASIFSGKWSFENSLHMPNFVPKRIIEKRNRSKLLNWNSVGGFSFFGRADELKGVSIYINAVQKLVSNDKYMHMLRPPRQVAFIGNVPSKKIKRKIRLFRKDMESRGIQVQILENFNTEAAIDYMIKVKLVPVTPSLYENFPMALLETVSAGMPTIHGSSGGQQEVSEANINIVQSGSVESLHDRLASVLEHGAVIDKPRVDHDSIVSGYSRLPSIMPKSVLSKPLESLPCADVTVCMILSGRDVTEVIKAFEAQSCVPSEFVFIHNCGIGLQCPTSTLVKGSVVREYHNSNVVSVGEARNFAMNKVTTRYFVLFDDDDMPVPSYIEAMVRAAELQQASLVTSFCANVLKQPSARDVIDGNVQTIRVSLAAGNTGLAVNLISHYSGKANILMRTDFYRRHGGCLPELLDGMSTPLVDWGLFTRVILNEGLIAVVPLPLYYYTMQSNHSLWYESTDTEKYFGRQKIIKHYCAHFSQKNLCQVFQLMVDNSLL